MTRFIDTYRDRFGVEPICDTLEVSASAYYQRKTGARSARAIEDERLLAVILKTHEKNYYAYGYRKMWKTLLRAGETAPRCQVQRLMAANGLCGAKRRGKKWKTTTPDGNAPRFPDLVDRDFTAQAPDRLWIGDFTYLRCWEGTVFFSFVIDVFSRKVVGWQLASHMRTAHVARRCSDVPIAHHPRSQVLRRPIEFAQYTSYDYRQELDDHRVLGSIGSVGDAYDNAMAESFVDSFKTELIKDRVWKTRSQLELAIVEYIGWFNQDRLHESLGDIPPVEFEASWAAATAAISGELSVAVTSPSASERLTTPRPILSRPEIGTPGRDQAENDAQRAAQNGSEDEPDPATTATELAVDERPQLVSLPLRI